MWRPEHWEGIKERLLKGDLILTPLQELSPDAVYEAGADAMLDALRARGILAFNDEACYIVIIPDEAEDNG